MHSKLSLIDPEPSSLNTARSPNICINFPWPQSDSKLPLEIAGIFAKLLTSITVTPMSGHIPSHLYFPGSTIDIRILSLSYYPSERSIRVHVFRPFMKSQVMQISFPPKIGPEFPQCAVLKLYDRRWVDDRRKNTWSPSCEASARLAWKNNRWGNAKDRWIIMLLMRAGSCLHTSNFSHRVIRAI